MSYLDWQFNKALPIEYHVLYVVQLSFYMHSIYATVVLDCWRKDSIVMLVHHFIAMSLIFFGFSTRAHQVGVIVLFLHDITDVILEGTKSLLYFKIQDKKEYPIFELIGNVGFLLFTAAWVCSRLYVFPMRLMGQCTILYELNHQVPLSFMVNSLLYLLLVMNVYWFTVSTRKLN